MRGEVPIAGQKWYDAEYPIAGAAITLDGIDDFQ